jgi:cold shock CspA family protein
MTGHIKRVFPGRGFGFITGKDGRDFFVHADYVLGGAFRTWSKALT